MINEKDRGQLLRMAGNIACGIAQDFDHHYDDDEIKWIGMMSARIALQTMQEIDGLIAENNALGNAQQQVQADSDQPNSLTQS